MNHSRVDRIMKQVAQHYLGDFSINSDDDLSRRIGQRIKSRNDRTFRSLSKVFGLDQMFCTDICRKEQTGITIPKDGVVFGPYYSFEKGDYFALFYLAGEMPVCQLQVASQEAGIITSAITEDMERRPDNTYLLPFALPEKVDNLEFKVVNCSEAAVIFEKVCISITEPLVIQPESTVEGPAFLPETELPAEQMEILMHEQGDLMRSVRELEKTADCEIMPGTRFRRIKRVIRKAMNSYIYLQQNFNHSVVSLCWMISRKLGHITETLAALMEHQLCLEEHSEKVMEDFSARLKEAEQKLAALEAKERSLPDAKQLAVFDDRMHAMEKDLLARLKEAEERMSAIEADTSDNSIAHDTFMERLANAEQDIQQWEVQCRQLQEAAAQHNLLPHETIAVNTDDITRLANDTWQIWEKIKEVDKEFAAIWEWQRGTNTNVSNLGKDIVNIWEKHREIDRELTAIWGHERDVNSNLASIWKTYNTLRQEVFYEIESRIKSSAANNGQSAAVEKKIKASAAAKTASAGGNIRLNLGSGTLAKEGYLSVDARDLNEVDVVADVSDLPYGRETVDEIYSAHLIEHFTRQKLEKELLPYWCSLLKSGGVFTVIFPDLEAMLGAYQEGKMSFEELGYIIMGGQDYNLDYHYAVYSPDVVISMLKAAGLRDIQIIARGRENGGCLETEIRAVK